MMGGLGDRLQDFGGRERYAKLLASASGDMTVRLWDALPLHERRALGVLSGK